MDNKPSSEFQDSLLRAIRDASPDGILVVDARDHVVSLNQRFLDVWGIPGNRTIGGRAGDIIGTPDQPILAMAVERVKHPDAFLARVKELYADPTQDDHCEIALKDGRTLERHSTVLRGEHGQYFGRVWFFRDVTTRKQMEASLLELASRDPLTGVANRRHFFQRAGEEFARSRRYNRALSLVIIDIDQFKRVNDRFGHLRGDEVLNALCEGCKAQLRESDLFARIGGDEFVVLLAETDLNGAQIVAEGLRRIMAESTVTSEGTGIRWTVSIGVATLTSDDATIEACLKRADQALYRAKTAGRNQIEVEPRGQARGPCDSARGAES